MKKKSSLPDQYVTALSLALQQYLLQRRRFSQRFQHCSKPDQSKANKRERAEWHGDANRRGDVKQDSRELLHHDEFRNAGPSTGALGPLVPIRGPARRQPNWPRELTASAPA